jgi:hypothetical protein
MLLKKKLKRVHVPSFVFRKLNVITLITLISRSLLLNVSINLLIHPLRGPLAVF